jgi:kynureninase
MAGKGFNVNSYEEARSWAVEQDKNDALKTFREKFYIPSQQDLKATTLSRSDEQDTSSPSTYLCGNSLGLQPKSTATMVQAFLTQWKTKGVLGHYAEHSDSPLAPFLHIDDYAAKLMAPLVGAQESEVAVMGTLTGNLHLMMASFYRPSRKGEGRYKVLLEGKAFPSDHVRS